MFKIRVGVSRCLLGDAVRYDGGHKKDHFLTETLGQFFEWVPVCPEVEAGMGVPRESVRLVESGSSVRMVGVRSQIDFTKTMNNFCSLRSSELKDLSGFIFKKDSPSCGIHRVRIYSSKGVSKSGRGLFAKAMIKQYPLMPVEEEGRLQNPILRENFIEQVFCYYRLTRLCAEKPAPADLIQFHTAHKMTLLSHSPDSYRKLGRIVALAGNKRSLPELLQQYSALFMEAIRKQATAGKHANVLSHLLGYLKKSIPAADKEELVATIDSYRKGLVPLIVPVTLLRHHFRHYRIPWIDSQVYLNPYPPELMLRNHV